MLGLFFGLFGLSCFLIYDEEYLFTLTHQKKIDTEILGTISVPFNDVRKKRLNDLTWYEVEEGESIQKSEMIFIGKNSHSLLTLKNGDKIELGENSLVILEHHEKKQQLVLKYGSMRAQMTSKTKIKMATRGHQEEIDTSNSTLNISLNEKDIKIRIEDGHATLKNPVRSFELTEPGILNLVLKDSLPTIKKILPPPKLIRPNRDEHFYAQEDHLFVDFSWEEQNAISPQPKRPRYALELSSSPDFSHLLYQVTLASTHHKARISTLVKSIYWRVRLLEEGEENFGIHSRIIHLHQERPPTLISPWAKQNYLRIRNQNDKTHSLHFQWHHNSTEGEYVLQISPFKNFNFITTELQTSAKKVEFRLPAGKYFWRMAYKGHIENLLWSQPHQFSIEETLFPASIQSFYPEDQQHFYATSENSIPLRWAFNENYPRYQLEIKTIGHNGKRDTKSTHIVDQSDYIFKGSKLSQFQWRVRPINNQGGLGEYSRTFRFSIGEKIPLPLLEVPEKLIFQAANPFVSPEQNALFWKVSPKYNGVFLLEISSDHSFKKIVYRQKVKNSSSPLPPLNYGQYFWRVTSYEDEKFLASKSTTGNFKIFLAPPVSTTLPKITFGLETPGQFMLDFTQPGQGLHLELRYSGYAPMRRYFTKMSKGPTIIIAPWLNQIEQAIYFSARFVDDKGQPWSHFGPILSQHFSVRPAPLLPTENSRSMASSFPQLIDQIANPSKRTFPYKLGVYSGISNENINATIKFPGQSQSTISSPMTGLFFEGQFWQDLQLAHRFLLGVNQLDLPKPTGGSFSQSKFNLFKFSYYKHTNLTNDLDLIFGLTYEERLLFLGVTTRTLTTDKLGLYGPSLGLRYRFLRLGDFDFYAQASLKYYLPNSLNGSEISASLSPHAAGLIHYYLKNRYRLEFSAEIHNQSIKSSSFENNELIWAFHLGLGILF